MDQQSETQLAEEPTVEGERARDAFLERINVAELDDFERRGLDRNNSPAEVIATCATFRCDDWGAGVQ
eukprot:4758591-Amphidinium_carterae.2